MARERQTWGEDPPSGPQLSFPRWTRAVRALILVNAAVFLTSFACYLVATEAYAGVVDELGLAPESWAQRAPLLPLWQLLSYGFLHSVLDPMHILMNMLGLYFFGTQLEAHVGTRPFVLTYFASQLLGALFYLATALIVGSPNVAVGASGAVYGVMLAVATLFPRQRIVFFIFPITLRTLAWIVVGITVFSALLTLKHGQAGGVAHTVHLGGLVWGILAARTGLVRWDPWQRFARKQALRGVESAARDEQRMDQLLEKIHKQGISSLTREERDFLGRVSSRR